MRRRAPPPDRLGGFWYGGRQPPSPLLVNQIDEEDPRSREVYALQGGRERGDWADRIELLRRQLPAVTDETAFFTPRSPAAAFRRALRRLGGDTGQTLDLLSRLGAPTGDGQLLQEWLTWDPRRRDDADAVLVRAWKPRPGSLLAALLEHPGRAAARLCEWLSPAGSGRVRIVTHGESGLSAPLRARLLSSRVAAYQCPGEVHLFEALTRHLEEYASGGEEDLQANPLSLLSTLLLHELAEVLVADREKPGPVAAHAVACTVERVCGRAEDLARVVNVFFDGERAAAGVAASGPRVRRQERGREPARVLVVEDSGMTRHLICDVVRQLGHIAVEAASGEEAVAEAGEHEPHLIVLDLGLPGGRSGLEYLSIIRQSPRLADTPAIVVTASTDGESVAAAAAMGIADYLIKPLRTPELASRIRRLLAPADEGA